VNRDASRWRVYAMARPCRPKGEGALVASAAEEIGAVGSRRARAIAVAERVAVLAVEQFAMDPLEAALARTRAAFETPSLCTLAFDEDAVAGQLVAREALAAFERRGCRHAPRAEWAAIDDALCKVISGRLAERYRRA